MQEINDLKNIVIQSLESKGILSQLRAQIRSSVFKIIEDQESKENKNPAFFWENPLCQKIHESDEGLQAVELMHEFFEFFRMDYTNNVFVHESNYKETFSRDDVLKKLHIEKQSTKEDQPLLMNIIRMLAGGLVSSKSNTAAVADECKKETLAIEPEQKSSRVEEKKNPSPAQEESASQSDVKVAINEKDAKIPSLPEAKKQDDITENKSNPKTEKSHPSVEKLSDLQDSNVQNSNVQNSNVQKENEREKSNREARNITLTPRNEEPLIKNEQVEATPEESQRSESEKKLSSVTPLDKMNHAEMSNDEKVKRLGELEMEITGLQAKKMEVEQSDEMPDNLKMQFMIEADQCIQELEIELQELLVENPFLLENAEMSGYLNEDFEINEEQDKAFKERLMEEEKEFEEFINTRPKDYSKVAYAEKAQRHYEITAYMEKIEEIANERISADQPLAYQEMITTYANTQQSLLRDELEEITQNTKEEDVNEEDLLLYQQLEEDQKNYEMFRDERKNPEDFESEEALNDRVEQVKSLVDELEDFIEKNGADPKDEKELTIQKIKEERYNEMFEELHILTQFMEVKMMDKIRMEEAERKDDNNTETELNTKGQKIQGLNIAKSKNKGHSMEGLEANKSDKMGKDKGARDDDEYFDEDFEDEIPEDIPVNNNSQDVGFNNENMYDKDDEGEGLVSSDEMYMSESLGVNFSVNSLALEEFDYVEEVECPDADEEYEEG